MSATTILVPVDETEARSLVHARSSALVDALVQRTHALRRAVGRVDAVREELHALLFPKWEQLNERPPGLWASLVGWLKRSPGATPSRGYDPFIHLFGRSLPIASGEPSVVARDLGKIVEFDERALDAALGDELATLSPATRELWSAARSKGENIRPSIEQELVALDGALKTEPADFRRALVAIARLSAWSRPVWRFDGEMLSTLLQTLEIGFDPQTARALFEPVPERFERELGRLPRTLESFRGTGVWLSSAQVKLLGASLRGGKRRLTETAARAAHPHVVLRHLRLLEEAVYFCETSNLALCEAAGVEWHERGRDAPSLPENP